MGNRQLDEMLTRRGLFRWAARGAAGAAGVGLVAMLTRRGQLRATKGECAGSGRCDNCDVLRNCKLPQAVFLRRSRKQEGSKHG